MFIKKIIFGEDVIDLKPEPLIHGSKDEPSKMALVGPTLSFTPPYIPTTFSFTAIIMMQGMPTDETQVRIELQNETNGKVIFSVDSVIPKNIPRNTAIPPELAGLNMNVPLKNVPMETEGKYSFRVFLNKDEPIEEKFDVVRNLKAK